MENEKLLEAARQEVERVNTERADVEARAVKAYQDAFVDTPKYQDLSLDDHRGRVASRADRRNPSIVGYLFPSACFYRGFGAQYCSKRGR